MSDAAAHVADDDLELYALGRLNEPALGRVEAHLLVCGNCRMRLDEYDRYVAGMRSALKVVRDARSEPEIQ